MCIIGQSLANYLSGCDNLKPQSLGMKTAKDDWRWVLGSWLAMDSKKYVVPCLDRQRKMLHVLGRVLGKIGWEASEKQGRVKISSLSVCGGPAVFWEWWWGQDQPSFRKVQFLSQHTYLWLFGFSDVIHIVAILTEVHYMWGKHLYIRYFNSIHFG